MATGIRGAAAGIASSMLVAVLVTVSGQSGSRPPTPLGLDEYFPTPEDNPLTADVIELGRTLFFDTRLSADGRVSCATCHKLERAFSDTAARSSGVHDRMGTRNTPALVNRAYGRVFFWDGRSDTLEHQVLQPFENPDEMDLALDVLTTRLAGDPAYRRLLAEMFGRSPSAADAARALASFVRAQRFGNTAFDRYQAGDAAALSDQARRGLESFRGRGNCSTCHLGPTFTDEVFHNTGVSWGAGDLGRFGVTGKDEDRGAFKTPTLRELARTAPYMHDGSLQTLNDVVDFYNRGGRANPFLDPEIRPLRLDDGQQRDLIEFLLTLGSRE